MTGPVPSGFVANPVPRGLEVHPCEADGCGRRAFIGFRAFTPGQGFSDQVRWFCNEHKDAPEREHYARLPKHLGGGR